MANKIENMPRVKHAPSHTHVPNKDNVFEAAVFLYDTRGEHSESERAANLFRKSLGTNAKIADVMLDNDTLHIKLVREFVLKNTGKIHIDYQWVSVCKRGYTATRPTHELEDFTKQLDSMLSNVGSEVRAIMLSDEQHTIRAHTWVPYRRARREDELIAQLAQLELSQAQPSQAQPTLSNKARGKQPM